MTALARRSATASTCLHCHRTFDARAWSALPLIDRYYRDQLRSIFAAWPWPLDAHLELRRCVCGDAAARFIR